MKLILSFSWIAFVFAIGLGAITVYISALRSARKASRISPIESIRNSSEIKIKTSKIKSPKIISKIFGIGGEISYKNLKRNKKKYRTTVISITVSTFVFIALSYFMSLAFKELRNELNLEDYNVSLIINVENKDELYEKVIETTKLDNIENYSIKREDGIRLVNPKYNQEYIDFFEIQLNEDTNYSNITVSVVGKEQYEKYIKSLGLSYEKMKDKAILCDYVRIENIDENNNSTYIKMNEYKYKVGDVISGITNKGTTINIRNRIYIR
jgi:putative ABC transport system permease protein